MSRPVVVSLCDRTGIALQPWAKAGFECYAVDVQHSIRADRIEGRIHYVWGDVRTWRPPANTRVIFGMAMTPCTDVAGSGARDFAKKGGYMLRDAVEMFEAARQALSWSGAPGYLENSVGLLSSIPHIGKPGHYFHPHEYAGWCEDDNYTKKTCIWPVNGFVMPNPRPATWLGAPDDRIHKATPSCDRGDIRSASPLGFARAVFDANYPTVQQFAEAA